MLFAVLLSGISAMAQNRPVYGTVTAEDGSALSGVAVTVQGTQTGVITDAEGKFTISAAPNSILELNIPGYTAKIVSVGDGRTPLRVSLEASSQYIDDVVVMGYGTAKKVGTVIGSVASVKADKFEMRPGSNVMDAIQGQVAGLTIMTSSGEPSATSTFRLHGIGSVPNADGTKNQPLILLDGSPITNGTLMMLNPSDFESINVLKDASATSIYGSRAANGVIFIVSKRGKQAINEGATVTLRTQYSMSNANRPRLEALNADEYINYMWALNEVYVANQWGIIINDAFEQKLRNNGNTDWFKEIYKKNAPAYQVDLNVTGGGRITSYYLSGSYNSTEGISPGSDMKRYNFNTQIEVAPKDYIKVGMGLSAAYSEFANSFSVSTTSTNWFSNPANGAILIPAFQPARDDKGNIIPMLELAGDYASPLIMPTYFPDTYNRMLVNGNMFVEITPIKNLVIKSNLAGNTYNQKRVRSSSPDYKYNGGEGWVQDYYRKLYSWTWSNTAEYKFDVAENNHFVVLAGHETIYDFNDYTTFGMRGNQYSQFMYLNHGTTIRAIPTYETQESAINSVFARIDYNYKEKYMFDASIRNDASSRFGSTKRNAVFYSIGGMWNMKKEEFLASSDLITQMSAKISWGTSGNSVIGDFAQYAMLEKIQYGGAAGWNPSTPGNPAIQWEAQQKLTVGVDVEFIDRIRVGLEFYQRDTRDMLMDVPIPRTTGFEDRPANVGHMRNSGIDLNIDVDIFKNRDWFVNFNTNFNYNKNKMLALFGSTTEQTIEVGGDTYMIVGEPFGVFKMFEWRGVDPETGWPQWTDAAGGITNNSWEAELINTGKSMYAPFAGGANLTASWKGLALTANLSWMAGRWMANNTRYFSENAYFADGSINQTKDALNYWKQPGDNALYPRLDYQVAYALEWDSHLLENASFVRLKNIQLSYSFPRKLLTQSKVFEGLRVWVSGRNLWTWTKYKGLDPEVDADYGLDNYPNSRQVSFGIELQF